MTTVIAELSAMRPDSTLYSEAQLAAVEAGHFADFLSLDGCVTLVHGEERFDVGDTLLYAVIELCSAIVPQLCSGHQAIYSAFAHEEELTFTRRGATLEITSEYRQGITLPADESLAALVDAGRRLVAMLPRLWPEAEPGHIETIRQQIELGAQALGLG